MVELPCPGPIRGGLGAGFADSSNMSIPGRLINPPGDESVLRFTVHRWMRPGSDVRADVITHVSGVA